ncbi:hypothetical protein AB7828_03405 [Tardiphaga sp. 215_C5_N2_1]|uniref:hypothetical protein n=1 Tax=Tardiphaga sp. 215_C5_N2_1 TaxID=3240774 RepID=UPI003F8A73C1
MAIDLGKWSWIAGTAVDFGLPILGTALGIPGPVSAYAICAIKKALNLPGAATPEDVKTAIAADPDTAKAALEDAQTDVQARYAYLSKLAEEKGLTDRANISEINKTIRAETGKVPWWHWWHLLGYLVLLYGVEQVAAIAYTMFGKGVPPDQLATLFNSTAIFTAGLFALLGYVASDNTARQQTAITGVAPEGVVASTIRAVTGREK